MLQRARVPSTRQEAVASSCPKTRVLVSYWLVLWLPGARGSIQSRDPLLVRTDRPGHPARVCRGKAEKRRRHRQRLLGRHVAVPAARGVAAGRRDSYPTAHTHAHTYLGQASHRGRLSLLARSASAAAAASEPQLEPVRSIAAPAAGLLLAFDRTRHTTPPSAWQLPLHGWRIICSLSRLACLVTHARTHALAARPKAGARVPCTAGRGD